MTFGKCKDLRGFRGEKNMSGFKERIERHKMFYIKEVALLLRIKE